MPHHANHVPRPGCGGRISGHTYERIAILSHDRNGAKDPLTGRALSSTKVTTNRTVRQIVQAWLDKHPGVTPDGWDSREFWSHRRMTGRGYSMARMTRSAPDMACDVP